MARGKVLCVRGRKAKKSCRVKENPIDRFIINDVTWCRCYSLPSSPIFNHVLHSRFTDWTAISYSLIWQLQEKGKEIVFRHQLFLQNKIVMSTPLYLYFHVSFLRESRCIAMVEKHPACHISDQINSLLLQWSAVSIQTQLHRFSRYFLLFWKLNDVQKEVCYWSAFHRTLEREKYSYTGIFHFMIIVSFFQRQKYFCSNFIEQEAKFSSCLQLT